MPSPFEKIEVEQRLKPHLRNPFQMKLMMRLTGPNVSSETIKKWVDDNAGAVSEVIDAAGNQNIRDLIAGGHDEEAIEIVLGILGWKAEHLEAA
jgi:hypothetical protein